MDPRTSSTWGTLSCWPHTLRAVIGMPERYRSDVALLAFVAWVCSVPFVLLVSMAYVGWQSGALLALLWLGVVATACFRCAHAVSSGAANISKLPRRSRRAAVPARRRRATFRDPALGTR